MCLFTSGPAKRISDMFAFPGPGWSQKNNGSGLIKPALIRLSEHLMDGYKKGIRPVYDWRHTTVVNIDLIVFAILGIEEKSQVLRSYLWLLQSWVDEFLTWDPTKFDKVTQISIPRELIWIPDIMIVEFVDTTLSLDTPYVYVDYQGRINNNRPLVVATACSLNTHYFPFDIQRCSISLTSWLHTNKDVNVSFVEKNHRLNQFKNNYLNDGEWDLINVFYKYRLLKDYEKNIGEYTLVIRRRPLFYTISLIMPSIFLMVINVAGFYLPPESGERISFKITLILGYSVFLIIVADTLPATGTPLIGIYYLMCMGFLMASLIESIFIVRMVHQHNVHAEVPKWLKRLVLEKLISVLGIQNKMFEELRKNPPHKPQGMETDGTGEIGNFNVVHPRESPMPTNAVLPVAENDGLLSKILKEIVTIREHVRNNDETITKEWLQVAYILDMFIFRAYLFAIITFAVSLVAIWSITYKV
ncbi:PREDICTED: 5-hydroxytryptamine receptor 3A-like [Nanorana parkeri]|uniref:5-hydroxytryptamine receptor 3A-like n=1 Tax=Nanorana parkeri TaxID=125878 RepID=UPI000855043F|nr:PREDICTED: 5-hydroxytryptamine receptor 3A-like [Nanorana parkeri]